jgi:hypothetical protein
VGVGGVITDDCSSLVILGFCLTGAVTAIPDSPSSHTMTSTAVRFFDAIVLLCLLLLLLVVVAVAAEEVLH